MWFGGGATVCDCQVRLKNDRIIKHQPLWRCFFNGSFIFVDGSARHLPCAVPLKIKRIDLRWL
jgi:hypothetical protein